MSSILEYYSRKSNTLVTGVADQWVLRLLQEHDAENEFLFFISYGTCSALYQCKEGDNNCVPVGKYYVLNLGNNWAY